MGQSTREEMHLKIEGYVDLTSMALRRMREDVSDIVGILAWVYETNVILDNVERSLTIVYEVLRRAKMQLPSQHLFPVEELGIKLRNVSEVVNICFFTTSSTMNISGVSL